VTYTPRNRTKVGENFLDIYSSGLEGNAGNWTTYADAAGTAPVDGTGGAPNTTLSNTTSSAFGSKWIVQMVKNSGASRQGEGMSAAFSIPGKFKARMLTIEFDYLIASGTFTAGTATTDSDITVWVYDVTNSVLIPVSPSRLMSNSTTLIDTFRGQFQTSSNSTSYRLILHIGGTTNAACTISFDNFSISPTSLVYSTPITDWQSYTPSGSWSTNTTYAGKWRRVGDSIQAQVVVHLGGVNTTDNDLTFTSAQLLNGLGLSIDTTKIVSTASDFVSVGFGGYEDSGTSLRGGVSATWDIANSRLTINPSTASNFTASSNTPITYANGDSISFSVELPIQGWSSNVQMSNNADNRIVAVEYTGNAGTSITAGTTNIPFTTKVRDTHGAFDGTTFTAPIAGDYQINASVYSSTSVANRLVVYKSGSGFRTIGDTRTDVFWTGSSQFYLNAGDTITLRTGGTNFTLSNDSTLHHLSIHRISGPLTVLPTETVSCFYTSATQTIGTSYTVMIHPTKVFDTHGAYNTTTGVFTCPVAGKYMIQGGWEVSGPGASSSGTGIGVTLYGRKNSTGLVRVICQFLYQLTGTNIQSTGYGSTVFDCNAGDTLDLALVRSASVNSQSCSGNATYNWIAINKIG
jgi:hypothetical protein